MLRDRLTAPLGVSRLKRVSGVPHCDIVVDVRIHTIARSVRMPCDRFRIDNYHKLRTLHFRHDGIQIIFPAHCCDMLDGQYIYH